MASTTITYPDNQQTRILNGIAKDFNYQATIDGEANPETKAQFVKRMIIERIRGMVLAGERKQADEDAVAALNQTALDIT